MASDLLEETKKNGEDHFAMGGRIGLANKPEGIT
jgi:hypothetical protein